MRPNNVSVNFLISLSSEKDRKRFRWRPLFSPLIAPHGYGVSHEKHSPISCTAFSLQNFAQSSLISQWSSYLEKQQLKFLEYILLVPCHDDSNVCRAARSHACSTQSRQQLGPVTSEGKAAICHRQLDAGPSIGREPFFLGSSKITSSSVRITSFQKSSSCR